jgi:hypothetical protein
MLISFAPTRCESRDPEGLSETQDLKQLYRRPTILQRPSCVSHVDVKSALLYVGKLPVRSR